MIYQIANVKTKTRPLPAINRDLLKARHIQAHVKEMAADGLAPTEDCFWSPMNAGPYLVPVSRWVE
jgi:hypothetical protein